MKIEAITLREIHMRLNSPFATSFGVTQDRRILLIGIRSGGVSGWGEVTTTSNPTSVVARNKFISGQHVS